MTKYKWTKTLCWMGRMKAVECKEHSYAWSGKIPCTGIRRCIYCGKPADEKILQSASPSNTGNPKLFAFIDQMESDFQNGRVGNISIAFTKLRKQLRVSA